MLDRTLRAPHAAAATLAIGFVTAIVIGLTTSPANAAPPRSGDLLDYPEGAPTPRNLTDKERRYVGEYPIMAARATDPPTGPLHCVAEYEPMEGLLIAWEGSSSWKTILVIMAKQVTTIGDATIFCVLDTQSEQPVAYSSLAAGGADMDRVEFVVRTTDTIWIRDYGPRYVYEGGCRAVIDHTYNRPRPNDNALPVYFAGIMDHGYYEIPLVHGGGNYHLNALDEGNASALIVNENQGLTAAEIVAYWLEYQNVETTIWTPFPTYIDSTQHIDMWMQVVDDDVIIISDWPSNPGSVQDQICDSTAADFTARGWSVHRIPARSVSGTHYTYTNMVLCNDLVLLPRYTNVQVSNLNPQALMAVQAACPDKTVIQVNCEAIVSSAGVMHCIVMHVPVPFGGAIPTAYLKSPRGGEVLEPGEIVEIRWISDDDGATTGADLLLSTNGGANFDMTIAADEPDDGSYLWTVPDLATTTARLRVVVSDSDGNTGADQSESDITITGTGVPGDVNGDGVVDFGDLLLVLSMWGPCPGCPEDVDGDGGVGFTDLLTILSNWTE